MTSQQGSTRVWTRLNSEGQMKGGDGGAGEGVMVEQVKG